MKAYLALLVSAMFVIGCNNDRTTSAPLTMTLGKQEDSVVLNVTFAASNSFGKNDSLFRYTVVIFTKKTNFSGKTIELPYRIRFDKVSMCEGVTVSNFYVETNFMTVERDTSFNVSGYMQINLLTKKSRIVEHLERLNADIGDSISIADRRKLFMFSHDNYVKTGNNNDIHFVLKFNYNKNNDLENIEIQSLGPLDILEGKKVARLGSMTGLRSGTVMVYMSIGQ